MFLFFFVSSFWWLSVCVVPCPTSPVDSNLKRTLIRLDLSGSQGVGLEIGLSSDWIVCPEGRVHTRSKRKSTLSFGWRRQGGSALAHTHIKPTNTSRSFGRLLWSVSWHLRDYSKDIREGSLPQALNTYSVCPRHAARKSIAIQDLWTSKQVYGAQEDDGKWALFCSQMYPWLHILYVVLKMHWTTKMTSKLLFYRLNTM